LQQCPTGLVFDPNIEGCNYPDLVFCPNLCPSDVVVNLPHNNNCSLYWLCVFGDPTLKQCAPGLLFDPTIGQCNVADQVECDVHLDLSLLVPLKSGPVSVKVLPTGSRWEMSAEDGDSLEVDEEMDLYLEQTWKDGDISN
jgi:hypothetical protein